MRRSSVTRVLDVQRRFRELGRIRLGDKGEKGQPQRLTKFRLTSASEDLLRHAAGVYGGEVQPWTDAPNEGYFEVYLDVDTLDIAIPPAAEPYSQAYELWSGGGCQRRCDGVTATVVQGNGIRERECMCNPDERECKLTTRVNVMLPRLPDVGVWRLESHGYNAAVELPGTLDLLSYAMEAGQFLQGRLRIEQRVKKVPGEKFPRRFTVPVIDLAVTMGELLSGETSMPSLSPPPAPSGRPELPVGPATPDEGSVPVDDGTPSMGRPPELPSGDATMAPVVDDSHDERPITEQQRKRMFAIAKGAGVSSLVVSRIARYKTGGARGVGEMQRGDYEAVVEAVETYGAHPDVAEARLAAWEQAQAPASDEDVADAVWEASGRREPDDPAPQAPDIEGQEVLT